MSTTVDNQLTEDQMTRLQREAERLGKSPSKVAACWVDEALRESVYPYIEFREAYRGRDAFLRGTRLLVNHVRANDRDIARTAEDLNVPEAAVASAMAYAAEYADEIEAAIAENRAAADSLKTEMTASRMSPVDAHHA